MCLVQDAHHPGRETTVAYLFAGLAPIPTLDQPGDDGPRCLENEDACNQQRSRWDLCVMQAAAEDLRVALHGRKHPSPCHPARHTADDAHAGLEPARAADTGDGLIKTLNLTPPLPMAA